jgi:hypothetical protein
MPRCPKPTPAHLRVWKTVVPKLPDDQFSIAPQHSARLAQQVAAANVVMGALSPPRRIEQFLRYERLGGHGPVAVFSVDILT